MAVLISTGKAQDRALMVEDLDGAALGEGGAGRSDSSRDGTRSTIFLLFDLCFNDFICIVTLLWCVTC